MTTWYERAQAHIRVVADDYNGDDLAQLEKTIRESYPFGERKYWPYKAWLKAVNDYMSFRRRAAGVGGVGKLSELPLFGGRQ